MTMITFAGGGGGGGVVLVQNSTGGREHSNGRVGVDGKLGPTAADLNGGL
jgi:hypothetical protein